MITDSKLELTLCAALLAAALTVLVEKVDSAITPSESVFPTP